MLKCILCGLSQELMLLGRAVGMHACSVTSLCPTLCDSMDCSPLGSSVQGILQAGILEWVAMPSSRDLPDPGIVPMSVASPALAGRFFTTSAPWEAQGSTSVVLRPQAPGPRLPWESCPEASRSSSWRLSTSSGHTAKRRESNSFYCP